MRSNDEIIILSKISDLPWGFILLMTIISGTGFVALYSAAGGSFDPWSSRQMVRFAAGVFIMLAIAVIDIRFWYRHSYSLYFLGLLLLLMVEFLGVEGGLGAQRWLNIAGFQFQPSELAKVFMVLALARYFHLLHQNNLQKISSLIIPVIIICAAALLVLKQPNLGTAAIIFMIGTIIIFLAGIGLKKFFIAGIIILAMLPVVWHNMHNYQKERIYTFLNPENDPLGAGYNIIQSKIAIGSGSVTGKGFLNGSQSRLSFVPEKQTDFVFSIIAEEFGFIGSLFILAIYCMLLISATLISLHCNNFYGKFISIGVTAILFLHVFINIGMVSGILPVVGVPLPLISYGGSSMISTLVGFGFILNAHIHRDIKVY